MKRKILAAMTVAALAPTAAFATTGYFQHGYGIKAKGMGGVGIALPQDSLAAATNPAGMAFVGNRLDAGLDWFRPIRDTEIRGVPIAEGDKVVMWYTSANRDERMFPEPFRFDVRRETSQQQVGYGAGGPHFCLGANLARREIGRASCRERV